MTDQDIQGTVTDSNGDPVSGAIVELTKSYQTNPQNEQVVLRTTTDSNGNYVFNYHPDSDETSQEWHVSAYSHDGSSYLNSFNNPGVTADLRSTAIPDSVVTQDLVAWYTFNDNNGVDNASNNLFPNVTWGDGTQFDLTFENGAQFGTSKDGTQAYYAIDDEDFARNTDIFLGSDPEFSVSMWTYRTKEWSDDGTFGLGAGDNRTSINSYMQTENENEIGFDLYSESRFYGGVEYPLNQWVHVAYTYTGSGMNTTSLSVYKNGTEISLTQERAGSTSPNLEAGFSISSIEEDNRNSPGGTGRYDDVRLYNRALTPQEVSDIFNEGIVNPI